MIGPLTGIDLVYAREQEIDPTVEDEPEDEAAPSEDKKLFQGLATAMPGIDEAMSFQKVMTLVQSMEFDIVVFDTAPTGHTLRFLQFPQMLNKTFGKLFGAQGATHLASGDFCVGVDCFLCFGGYARFCVVVRVMFVVLCG